MSNKLYITVTEFKDLAAGTSEFGFTAFDSVNGYYDSGYGSIEAFQAAYPSEEDLIQHVLNLECFESSGDPDVVCSYPALPGMKP